MSILSSAYPKSVGFCLFISFIVLCFLDVYVRKLLSLFQFHTRWWELSVWKYENYVRYLMGVFSATTQNAYMLYRHTCSLACIHYVNQPTSFCGILYAIISHMSIFLTWALAANDFKHGDGEVFRLNISPAVRHIKVKSCVFFAIMAGRAPLTGQFFWQLACTNKVTGNRTFRHFLHSCISPSDWIIMTDTTIVKC